MSKKISALTALTTPADGDLLPIVDVSDTTDAASGTTKKIALSNFFPSSSTDNAIARFDSTTGKLLQDSGITVSDIGAVTANQLDITSPAVSGQGTHVTIKAGESTDGGAVGYFIARGAHATSGNIAGGYGQNKGGNGFGSGVGGVGGVYGGAGGATGTGGTAIVQGGAGGATSGNGGAVSIKGGNATNGDGVGGVVYIIPGTKSGSGFNGTIRLRPTEASTYEFILNISSVDSSSKTITFPNATGALALQTGVTNYAADTASNDTYVITLAPVPASLVAGMALYFKATTANTTDATLNVNGLGAVAIVKGVSTALSTNDILAGMMCHVVYDGTNFILLNPRAL